MDEACRFIDHSVASKVPANVFIVVDTHADTLTGSLQWAGGVTAVRTAPMSELLAEFCGKAFLDKAKGSAVVAREFQPPENPGWYKDSPFFRGGWRGLLLATCGPAVRIHAGFDDLKRLVDGCVFSVAFASCRGAEGGCRDRFDFVLAFAGSSTLSSHVKKYRQPGDRRTRRGQRWRYLGNGVSGGRARPHSLADEQRRHHIQGTGRRGQVQACWVALSPTEGLGGRVQSVCDARMQARPVRLHHQGK
jgi:hypothetical protein